MKRLAITTLVLALCACTTSSTIHSNDQFTGNELEFRSFLSFGLDIPPAALAALSPEAVERIYTEFAKAMTLPPNTFNDWFAQIQTTDQETSAQIEARVRAMVAQELSATESMKGDDSNTGDTTTTTE